MRPLASSLASFALLSLVVAAGPATAAAGTAQIVQQRLSDGRILLTDRPVRGATTERSWQMRTEDPAVAQRRAAEVSAEAQLVSERIQRMLDEQRRADEESARTRVAALAMERQARSDEPVYLGSVVGYGPYGYGYGYGFGFADRRHDGKPFKGGKFEHGGKFDHRNKFDKGSRLGHPGSFGLPTRPAPSGHGRGPMFGR